MKTFLLSVTAILLLFAGYITWAQAGGMMGGGMGGGMMGFGQGGGQMTNPNQWGYNRGPSESQAYRSSEDFYNSTRQLRRDLDAKEDALNRELNSKTPDETKVNQLRKELSALQNELDQQWADYHRSQAQNWSQGQGPGWYGGPWQLQR
jgi:Spy/CpxP family protein refolding chaperone